MCCCQAERVWAAPEGRASHAKTAGKKILTKKKEIRKNTESVHIRAKKRVFSGLSYYTIVFNRKSLSGEVGQNFFNLSVNGFIKIEIDKPSIEIKIVDRLPRLGKAGKTLISGANYDSGGRLASHIAGLFEL